MISLLQCTSEGKASYCKYESLVVVSWNCHTGFHWQLVFSLHNGLKACKHVRNENSVHLSILEPLLKRTRTCFVQSWLHAHYDSKSTDLKSSRILLFHIHGISWVSDGHRTEILKKNVPHFQHVSCLTDFSNNYSYSLFFYSKYLTTCCTEKQAVQ